MSASRRLWLGLRYYLPCPSAFCCGSAVKFIASCRPMPQRRRHRSGQTLYTRADIERGRQVWQSIGGQQLGSIWGHGSYVAPDWTADWLHREAPPGSTSSRSARRRAIRRALAGRAGRIRRQLRPRIRANTYDANAARSSSRGSRCSDRAGGGALHGLVRERSRTAAICAKRTR